MSKNGWFRILLLIVTGFVACVKNSPPQIPEPPAGVSIGGPNIPYQFSVFTLDPDGDSVSFRFLWADGDTSDWSPFVPAGETVVMSHIWSKSGNYQVRAQAQDKSGGLSDWSRPCLLIISDGILKWRFQTGGVFGFISPAIGSDGTVYFGAEAGCCAGCLYALNPDGTLKWRFQTEDWVASSPAIGSDGTVYIGSGDGYLYAIQGSSSLADSPWPKFRHDNQNTGRIGGGVNGQMKDGKFEAKSTDGCCLTKGLGGV